MALEKYKVDESLRADIGKHKITKRAESGNLPVDESGIISDEPSPMEQVMQQLLVVQSRDSQLMQAMVEQMAQSSQLLSHLAQQLQQPKQVTLDNGRTATITQGG
jgi:hypothetical protein